MAQTPRGSGSRQPNRPDRTATTGTAPASSAGGRERAIAEPVAFGATNREIAGRLFLTEGTANDHVAAALRELGLRDHTQLGPAHRPTRRTGVGGRTNG